MLGCAKVNLVLGFLTVKVSELIHGAAGVGQVHSGAWVHVPQGAHVDLRHHTAAGPLIARRLSFCLGLSLRFALCLFSVLCSLSICLCLSVGLSVCLSFCLMGFLGARRL